jgi:hypothetical protein
VTIKKNNGQILSPDGFGLVPGVFYNFAKRLAITLIVIAGVFSFSAFAYAAVTEDAPPIDVFFSPTATVGGGSVIPLAQFRLIQASGADTVSQVGLQIYASSTVSQGEISQIMLWKESGATPGFQQNQDIFVIGAASTSPYLATSTMIVLTPTTPINPGSSGTQFYIVASTTATSGITNGHAFNINMMASYASTTAGSGVGTAFRSNKKVILNQSATLKISEVKAGATGNGSDEFIELYNSGDADINLSDLPLAVHSFYTNGSSTPAVPLTYYKKVIPAHGYFLIANPIGYSGGVPPDAIFATSTFSVLLADGGLTISTSTPGDVATSTAIDYVGWGSQPVGNCEGRLCAPALPEDGTSLERVAVGFPSATSTAVSLRAGGSDATKGNSYDSGNNSVDFVIQTPTNPQNSASPVEFPFGGGGTDNSKLNVAGSFPGTNQQSVPVDIPYVGFMFNKSVSTTTIISASATTTVTLTAQGSSTNLCSSVAYNPFPSNFEPQGKCVLTAQLTPSTSYTFTINTTVYDLSNNALDQDAFQAGNQSYQITFTTGAAGQTMTNVTPPQILGTTPFRGTTNIPTNIAKIAIEWNQSGMNLSTFTSANISLSGGITLSGFNFSTSTGKNILTATLSGALSANTTYTLTVGRGVLSSNGIPLPVAYTSTFTTGAGADTTAPTVVGILPAVGTTIGANTNDFVFTFDDNIDATTATSGAAILSITGGGNLPASLIYLPVAKETHLIPNNVLPLGQSLTLTIKKGALKNISGTAIASNIIQTWTVEAANSDSTGPSVIFANADDFSLAITFNEAVNQTDATNLSNYALTIGGVSQTLSALAGQSITYDPTNRTARLTGVRIAGGSSFTISAQNIKDISGNMMSGSSSFSGTAVAYSSSGGNVGPGSFSGSTFGEMKDFSSAGIGFMPPVSVKPTSTFVNLLV